MNFCFVINDKYVNYLIVLLQSICDNTRCEKINVFVLTKRIDDSNLKKINDFCKEKKINVEIINVDDSILGDVPLKRKDFNRTPYYKLLIPLTIPNNIDKILYMDVDMIVNKDIYDLYNIDINGYCFAAVPDCLINKRDISYIKRLNIDLEKGERYFNSGLILFNLKKLRENYNINDVKKYIENNGKFFKYHDQEVLNGLYFKEYYQLDIIYNYFTIYTSLKDFLAYKLCFQKRYFNKIYVLHYANSRKPWSDNFIGKYRKLFWKYAKKTIIYDEIKSKRFNNPIKSLCEVIKHILK